ncbi:hypothetical protein E1262_15860 [Jiangella aurantiaca]|uniref:LppM domain-containing protein n=1 Tax=Jiangella aurantiaca TaxID=2530373 RepID=A0A4R5AA27_9ACTN|nr:hypothetical protein [Jiangella aurantiaca]TDD68495.1 hypothetical protein E1262_15860 [Jiangella aurantiaca]
MTRTRPVRALTVAATALLLTGCIKMDMQLDVSENDTVAGDIVLALSRDVSAMAEAMGEDPSAAFGELGQDLPEGTEVEDYEDDRFVGQRYVFEDLPLSEFSEVQEFSIAHEGDEIVVDGSLDMTEMDPEALAGELGGDAGELGDMDQLMESLEMSVSITFPGEVTEHNGELDGTTVTWAPVPGEVNEISARSADSGGGGGDGIPVWIWILIVVVVLGLAALLFFLSRNRDQAPPVDAAAAGAAPPPPGAAPFAPPSGGEAPAQPTTPLPAQPDAQPPAPPAEPATEEQPRPPAEGDQPEPPAPPAAPR